MPLRISRREFAERLTFAAFWAAVGAAVLGMLKLIKPAVMPEAAMRLKLGFPEEFPPGTARVFEERGVFVFSDRDGIFAISAVCPHLGCVVRRLPGGEFDCPCHGSRFNRQGEVFAGPSPGGLSWLDVTRAPNGVLYADTASTVPAGTKWSAS